MVEILEFKKLNGYDRHLIASATKKSKNLVDKVLRGVRRNKLIISTAEKVLEKKAEMAKEILEESITEH